MPNRVTWRFCPSILMAFSSSAVSDLIAGTTGEWPEFEGAGCTVKISLNCGSDPSRMYSAAAHTCLIEYGSPFT